MSVASSLSLCLSLTADGETTVVARGVVIGEDTTELVEEVLGLAAVVTATDSREQTRHLSRPGAARSDRRRSVALSLRCSSSAMICEMDVKWM